MSGLVLAGGAARRMQAGMPGTEKGLLPLAGRPLVAWQIDNLRPQVGALMLNANRQLPRYARFGLPVLPDQHPGLPGPLAGIHAGLRACPSPWLAVAACDTPFLPPDWVARLHAAALAEGRRLAYAADPVQAHPLVALVHRSLLPTLDSALASGDHRVRRWFHQHDALVVPFADPRPFFNINTPAAWQEAEAMLRQMSATPTPPTSQSAPQPSTLGTADGDAVLAGSGLPDTSTVVAPDGGAVEGNDRARIPGKAVDGSDPIVPPGIHALCASQPGLDPDAMPLAQAQALLARYVQPVAGTHAVPLAEALHRVLAAPVIAPFDLPPHDNAAMDGYALRHADLSADAATVLPVAGRSLAGDPPAELPAGHAWRIFTGAPLPAGADLVIMQEQVERLAPTDPDGATAAHPARIRVPAGQRVGQNIRRRGEDLQTGSTAIPAGRWLQAADLGVAASLGHASLDVRRPLRVGVLSTGNELHQPAQPLPTLAARAPTEAPAASRGLPQGQPAPAAPCALPAQPQASTRPLPAGHIHDSNRPTLLALVRSQGFEAHDLGVLPDQPEALRQALARAAGQVDVILSTGGAAGGDADLIRQVTAAEGEAMSWKLRLRPGRPLVVGRIGHCLLLGLPGNPVAAALGYLMVVNDALRRMAGMAPRRPLPVRARADRAVAKRPGRTELLRVQLQPDPAGDGCIARIMPSQSSAMLSGLAQADGIAVLAEDAGPVAAGDWLEVIPLHGLLPGGA